MYNKAIEVLNIFYNNGFIAYIVGGYPRDNLLGIKTKDIDICTNAKPMDIIKLFDIDNNSNSGYGSLRVIYKGYKYDVTTFRKDIRYENNRKPIKIKYINDLKKDLLRRDFTVNTICIDKDGNYIDILNNKDDIDKRLVKCVGNPKYKIKEDSLRILRAVRFATILDFEIEKKTGEYLKKYGYLLEGLSNSRKKEELQKIFSSKNKEKGRELLIKYDLVKYLGISNLDNIIMCDDIIGIWSQLDFKISYPFSKLENEMISKIKGMLKEEINSYTIYKYGLYVSTVVGSIKGISYKKINDMHSKLVINTRKDININGEDIIKICNKEPGEYIKKIYDDIEKKIINLELNNKKDDIEEYIKNNY